jgi:hypothetical protein
MKSWWKGGTRRAKTPTELTGAEVNRLAAELQVVAGGMELQRALR